VTIPSGRQRRGAKPRLYVLYRQTVDRLGFDQVLRRLRGRAAGVLLEWNERRRNEQYAAACQAVGIELVQCVGPWMTASEIRSLLSLTTARPLVYLMSAERTGGTLFSPGMLARCADLVRRTRPDARVAAGFGIATPQHVKRMKCSAGIDAVIVGTAFLKAASGGIEAARRFIEPITEAL
jgi:tryptophan synthase alpha subunit